VPWPDGYANEVTETRFNAAQIPRVESYRGFIFGTLNMDMPPLTEYLGDVKGPLDEWLDFIESMHAGKVTRTFRINGKFTVLE